MNKLDVLIEQYKKIKKPKKVLPKWSIVAIENNDNHSLEYCLETTNNCQFNYKYHSIIKLEESTVFLKDKHGKPYSIDFLINIFVDLLNGGVQDFQLTAEMHGLINGSSVNKKSYGLIQVVDRNTDKTLFSQKTKDLIASA